MKKVVSLLLALCLVFACCNTQVKAADETVISLTKDNCGRGKMLVDFNDDGSVFSKVNNVSFLLPEAYPSGETYTIHITGSSDGDFRVWFINTEEVTNSEIWQASVNGFTSGDFDYTFTLTTTAESNEIFFKAPTWDSTINNLTIKSITITKGAVAEEAAPAEETATEEVAEDTTADTTEEAAETTTDATPKTGDAMNVVAVVAVMGLAAVAFVASKKKKALN